MASTDAKSGFRLPWSSDRNESDDRGETPAGETAVVDRAEARADTGSQLAGETTSPPVVEPSPDATTPASQDATTPASQDATTPASEAAPVAHQPAYAAAPGAVSDAAPVAHEAPAAPARKPNKFMAELTRAMQAAAEAARIDTLERFSADAKAHIEGIHASTADESVDLRKRADDDIAAILEWSKAEITRIREEADERVTHRKEMLEREIEAHVAEIEARIERVQARVAAFEAEMSSFFERLLAEDDPTRFAAMAETLPEPPPFDASTWSAPLPETPTVDQAAQTRETVGRAATAVVDRSEAAPAVTTAEGSEVGEPVARVDVADSAGEATSEIADASPVATDTESALSETSPTDNQPPTDTRSEDTGDLLGLANEAVEDGSAVGDATADASPASESHVSDDDLVARYDQDPRLSALGIAQDFADAEAEAAAYPGDGSTEASESDESIPVIADDALAARLAGLVPEEHAAPSDPATTRVVVTGLVSVASIAGFKRNLARVAGVRSVGVSSGPDGEFVFAVVHDPGLVLSDGVATLPGFGARVMNEGPGELTVAARDPETEG